MRMKRLALIFLAVAIIWLTVLFLFSNNLGEQNRKTFYSHLTKLENGIQDQFKSNNQIIKEAQEYLEQQQDLAQELHEKKGENQEIAITNPRGPVVESPEGKLPVLVFACNRVSITRCLDKLLQYRPDPDKFPIIVSQDCDHEDTANTIRSYGSQLTLIQQPDQSDIQVPPKEKKFKGYFKIARHYGWALNQMFFNFNFSSVIIVEGLFWGLILFKE